jgi:hypothetical protein
VAEIVHDTVSPTCLLGACLALALTGGAASANLVTSIPGGTVVPMPAINYSGPGPQTFSPGITWTSTNATNQGGSVFGYTGVYSYIDNGLWDGRLGPMAGLNDSFDSYGVTDTMTFSFTTPVGAVGGLLNYAPAGTHAIIAAYAGGTLIESDTLTFLTGGGTDTGMFLGFQETTPEISSFTLTDNFIGITNLTLGPPAAVPAPEPGTVLLLAGSLGVLGLGVSCRKFLCCGGSLMTPYRARSAHRQCSESAGKKPRAAAEGLAGRRLHSKTSGFRAVTGARVQAMTLACRKSSRVARL